jgi:hemolysin-activating ACP:hemolysin acyltransferase
MEFPKYPETIKERTTQFEITGIDCSLPLTESDFKTLVSLDYLDIVLPLLERKGAYKIEYNEHCGSYIYWSCESREEAKEIIETIFTLLD